MRALALAACLFVMFVAPTRADAPGIVVKHTAGHGRIALQVQKPGYSAPVARVDHHCVVLDLSPDETFDNFVIGGVTYRLGPVHCDVFAPGFALACVANCPVGSILPPTPNDVRSALDPPRPVPRTSPSLSAVQTGNLGGYLVGLPIYFAVDPATWIPEIKSITAAGLTLSVTATPILIDIDVDGEHFQCEGPGEIVGASNWKTTTDDCSHVFTTRGVKPALMTIIYEHVYSANFPTDLPVGELGESPTVTFDMPVVEVQPVLEQPGT